MNSMNDLNQMREQCATVEMLRSLANLKKVFMEGHEGWANVPDEDVVNYYENFVKPKVKNEE